MIDKLILSDSYQKLKQKNVGAKTLTNIIKNGKREICDQSPIVSNRNLLVTVTRLFIRILLNAKNKKFTIWNF